MMPPQRRQHEEGMQLWERKHMLERSMEQLIFWHDSMAAEGQQAVAIEKDLLGAK